MGVPECEGRGGSCASRRTLSRGNDVVPSTRGFWSLADPPWKRVTEGRRPKIIERGLTQISRAGNPKRPHPNCQGRLLHQRHCSKTPRCRGVGTPSWAGPLTTSLRGLCVSGYLLRAMADRAQGRRPDNRPGGDDSDPGLASRRERGLNCHQTEYSRTSVDCINAKRGGGPKTPLYEGQGPENPGVVAPFAVASCRGNCRHAVDRRLGKIDLRPCLPRVQSSFSFLIKC